MKEGGLGDVKFTLVSYLPRYPTDLMHTLHTNNQVKTPVMTDEGFEKVRGFLVPDSTYS